MKSIFEDLWNGNITPYKTNGKNDPEVEELAELMVRNKAALDQLLNETQRKALDKYLCCCDSYYYLLAVHGFRTGFTIASKMFAEVAAEDRERFSKC